MSASKPDWADVAADELCEIIVQEEWSRDIIAAALRQAEKRGQERMRERYFYGEHSNMLLAIEDEPT